MKPSPVHEYFYVSGPALLRQRLRQLGRKYLPTTPASFSAKGCSISSWLVPSIVVPFGSWECRLNPPPGLASMWKSNLSSLLPEAGPPDGRFPEGRFNRKFLGQGGADIGLNLLLQLLSCGSLERWQAGIVGVGDESALRIGLDAVGKRADCTVKIHRVWRDCSALWRRRKRMIGFRMTVVTRKERR